MLKLGTCCSGGLCCLALAGALLLGGHGAVIGEADDKAGTKAGCAKNATVSKTPCAATAVAGELELTPLERRVVDHVSDGLEAGGAPTIDAAALAQALGLKPETVEGLDGSRIRTGVIAELSRRGFDLTKLGGNCSRFKACSVDRNLMNARGEDLERYEAEVAMDGARIDGTPAPDFTLPMTGGSSVSLAGIRGRNVAVVLLSGHCHHSLDTLPILAELKQEYAGSDLEIVPIFVNTGDVETVASRAWEWDVGFPLAVDEHQQVAQAFESRMVPSTFLIDEEGRLTRRLVGFKDRRELAQAFADLIGS